MRPAAGSSRNRSVPLNVPSITFVNGPHKRTAAMAICLGVAKQRPEFVDRALFRSAGLAKGSPMRMAAYWTTEDADPRDLYHDVLVAIDESRRLNNGQPSLWACLYDQLELASGNHIVHVGIGTGYYSAILAEIVGSAGHVTAIEIDPGLAEQARSNLALAWRQVTVVTADGFTFQPERPADAIVVNAGVSHLSLSWLDALTPENGRLLIPFHQC